MALAVDNPTRQSFVSELVPPADLPNAIGLSSAIFQLARVLGPALAGVLILAGGTGVLLRAQRGVVRVRHHRAADDAHGGAAPVEAARP